MQVCVWPEEFRFGGPCCFHHSNSDTIQKLIARKTCFCCFFFFEKDELYHNLTQILTASYWD